MVQVKKNPTFHGPVVVQTKSTDEILSQDWTSIQGQFGWAELVDTTIPYLTRSGQKYVCMRMAENKIFLKYRKLFSHEVWSCFNLDKLTITKPEVELLNEINIRHCDGFFGHTHFTLNDAMVALDDIKELYDFLEFCYAKLVEKSTTEHKKCGFIRIAGQNCVPYVLYQGKQYVPLFYFEGECKYLEDRAIELNGWELAYIKFSCKIQGIRKALFDKDSIRMVEMDLVKRFFPPDTVFEYMWMAECNVESLLLKLGSVPANKTPGPVEIHENAPKKKAVKPTTYPYPEPYPGHFSTPHLTGVPPPPLGVAREQGNLQTNRSTSYNRMPGPYPLPSSVSRPSGVPPPPLYPAPSTYPNQYIPSTTLYIPNSTPQRANTIYVNKPTYPAVSTASSRVPTIAAQSPICRLVSNNSNGSRVFQISDFADVGSSNLLVKCQLEGKLLNCINMLPNSTDAILVPVEDLATMFFGVSIDAVVSAVNVMHLDIFLPNNLHMRYMKTLVKNYKNYYTIQYKDLVENLPQIRYILSSLF